MMTFDLTALEWAAKVAGTVMFLIFLYRACKPEELQTGWFFRPIELEEDENETLRKFNKKIEDAEQHCYKKAEHFKQKSQERQK